ncbi:MAG: alginate lyase family protein [Candidatus Marinimicrobia bacterium]|nr:alginate lyase family protein [Candidatus Neomarinimicrobiota bacterium]
MNIIKYLSTIEHLKIIQIIWRFILIFNKLFLKIFSVKISYEKYNIPKLTISNEKNESTEYKLFDEKIYLKNINWSDKRDNLKSYHLHYFDFLKKCDRKLGIQIVDNWMYENIPSTNNVGWQPYPISLRIVNWIFFLSEQNLKPSKKIIDSLFLQGKWLFKQREYHLMANHLFKNIVGLFYWGVFFRDKKIMNWSIKNLEKQLDEQFDESGFHFEYSSTYHALSIKDSLDMLNLIKNNEINGTEKLQNKLKKVIEKGLAIAEKMYFKKYIPVGDVNYQDCSNYRNLKKYSEVFNLNVKNINSTINPLIKNNHLKLMLINSPFSPKYNSAHSHQDKLSILLWHKGKPIFTDTGNYSYNLCEERKYSRSVEAHNTIQIDDFQQAEMWDTFRVGYRGNVGIDKITKDEIICTFQHKKYRQERKIEKVGDKIVMTDIVQSKGSHDLKQYFHIHPENRIEKLSDGIIINDVVKIKFRNKFEIIETDYYPAMYQREKQKTVIVKGDFNNYVKIVTEIIEIV